MLPNLRIILVNTSHPGNIGATARAMKNMGLERLTLVNPERFPSPEAIARASGANNVLDNAQVVNTLEEAIADCTLVLGASARSRALAIPVLNARECGEFIAKESHTNRIGLLFGREYAGLTNAELQSCHYHIHIPCNPDFSSLNLAAAVQVVCYEIFMAMQVSQISISESEPLATAEDMAGYYRHLEEVMIATKFLDPKAPKQLMARLKRLYNRAKPDKTELNILRGILTEIQKHLRI